MTQEALAEKAGYSTVYVSMLERGQRAPLPSTLDALVGALGLSTVDRAALKAASEPDDNRNAVQSLIGRERDMQFVGRFLGGEGPPVLLFGGEPGIGKTRLLEEAAVRATTMGWTVLRGGCQRRGGQQPYSPLLEAIGGFLAGRTDAQIRTDMEGAAWLVRLLPELATRPIEPLPAWALPPEQERRLRDDAVGRCLANVAGRAGTLLVLDDLQWVGSDALDLLAALARNAGRLPLRIVGAYRDIEVPARHPLTTVLADLGHAALVSHLSLGPLSPSEAAQLLDRCLEDAIPADPHLRERVLRRADGVPFFVVSCAQGLRTGVTADGERDDIPWDITQSIRQRVAALPEGAADILAATAIAGRRASPVLLASVTGQPELMVIDMLEVACGARLLIDEEATYSFSHEVVREFVEGDISPGRRTLLHRRVAEALEAQATQVPVEILAYHFARSGEHTKAVVYLERAGDGAKAQYAHATAEGYYRELVDRLDALGQSRRAAHAREKLGTIVKLQGRYDSALEILEEAAATYGREGDREREGRTVAQIGRVHYQRGTPEEGIARLQALRGSLDGSQHSSALAEVNVALAPLYLARARYTDQYDAAERASRIARENGDTTLLGEAEVWRGCAMNQLGNFAEGRRVQEAAIPLTEASRDFTSLSHALNDLAFAYEIAGEFARSRGYKERALRIAERLGDPAGIANMLFRCGQNAFLAGDWSGARQYFDRALEAAHPLGASSIGAYPLFGLGLLTLVEGDRDRAHRLAMECAAMAERSGDLDAIRAATGLLAEVDLAAGNAHAARARLSKFAPEEEGLSLRSILPTMAEACVRSGDREGAEEWATTSKRQAETRQNYVSLLDALRVHALIASHAGDVNGAIAILHEALGQSRTMRYPLGEGRILLTAGEILVGAGRKLEARGRLQEAGEIFRRLGAGLYAKQVEAALPTLRIT